MRIGWTFLAGALVASGVAGAAEEICRVTFDGAGGEGLFANTWGDKPTQVVTNGAVPGAGADGGSAGVLALQFGEDAPNNLSYWTIPFPKPIPIVPQLQELSFRVKANVPVSIKVPIAPFGFIYHGAGTGPTGEWVRLVVPKAYDELKAWCARGERNAEDGRVPGLIVAIGGTRNARVEVAVDDVGAVGAEGVSALLAEAERAQRYRRVRLSVVTLPWSEAGRSLESVLDRLDEAGRVGSDLVCLPMECVRTAGEAVPGPLSLAVAAKAKEHRMYVVGNLRETDAGKTYVTSFLCDRQGEIVGRYRKSHKMPDEDMDLGDDLPVFKTDLGTVAMRVGSDRFFADIDHVYAAKGAGLILWSQAPEPVEDEQSQDLPSQGRAADHGVFIACARYSRAEEGWITNFFPPYRGCPIGRSYVANREGERVACTTRKGAVATAVVPAAELAGPGRSPSRSKAFAVLTAPVTLPEPRTWTKRRVRVTAIENHVAIADLLTRLDEAGKLGSDIVCTYEFVWISGGPAEKVAQQTQQAKDNLRQVADKARQWGMYVLVAGVIDRLERNEAICYGRDGREVGRYFKIVQTHPEQIVGDDTPIIETDFGRIGVRICADNALLEIDRAYGVKGADIIFFLTQDWGPDAILRNRREITRAMDAQAFLVQATHASSETTHRSFVSDPAGMLVAASAYRDPGLVTAVIDLDKDRPPRYARTWTPHRPAGYLPEYQSTELPAVTNDLRETILRQRRPELYGVLAPEPPAK